MLKNFKKGNDFLNKLTISSISFSHQRIFKDYILNTRWYEFLTNLILFYFLLEKRNLIFHLKKKKNPALTKNVGGSFS